MTPVGATGSGSGLDRAGRTGETGAELFHAAGFDDTRLGARVERVRFGGHVALEERVRLAVDFDGFARVDRRTGDELVARLQVGEDDFCLLYTSDAADE